MRPVTLILLMIALFTLGGCGQKGPLTLPDAPQGQQTEEQNDS